MYLEESLERDVIFENFDNFESTRYMKSGRMLLKFNEKNLKIHRYLISSQNIFPPKSIGLLSQHFFFRDEASWGMVQIQRVVNDKPTSFIYLG